MEEATLKHACDPIAARIREGGRLLLRPPGGGRSATEARYDRLRDAIVFEGGGLPMAEVEEFDYDEGSYRIETGDGVWLLWFVSHLDGAFS